MVPIGIVARTISLSEEAFRVLRAQKQSGESDSDVLLRLAREAHKKRKNPLAFFQNPPRPSWSGEEYERVRDRARRADQERARRAWDETAEGA